MPLDDLDLPDVQEFNEDQEVEEMADEEEKPETLRPFIQIRAK